jgi:small redox-active disulfide protein 2
MKIEILGTGCAKCKSLEENTRAAADKLGLEYELEKVHSIAEITRRGVMMTPALLVEGTIKSVGKVLTPAEAEKVLTAMASMKPAP